MCGTSKNANEIRVKNFSNFFVEIENSLINNLTTITSFQCNTIYCMDEDSIKTFYKKFIGNISQLEKEKIFYSINDAFDKGVWVNSYFSIKNISWITLDYGDSFILVASRHNKKSKKIKTILMSKIKESKRMIKILQSTNKNILDFSFKREHSLRRLKDLTFKSKK